MFLLSTLDICDLLLRQPYLWKRHVVYESRPHSMIIYLGDMLYRIPEVAPPTSTSLITAKKCSKIISHTRKFILFLVFSQSQRKTIATFMTPRKGSSTQQKQVDTVMKEVRDIFSSMTGVLLHCQVKHSSNMTSRAPLPNGPIYHHSILENENIKWEIQELLQKGHI